MVQLPHVPLENVEGYPRVEEGPRPAFPASGKRMSRASEYDADFGPTYASIGHADGLQGWLGLWRLGFLLGRGFLLSFLFIGGSKDELKHASLGIRPLLVPLPYWLSPLIDKSCSTFRKMPSRGLKGMELSHAE